MLYRKKRNEIKEWLKESNKALLVTGARQVGKTYLIEHVLEQEKADFVKFDLINQPEVITLFDDVEEKGVDVFLSRLSLLTTHRLQKGKTVLFFDEIQKCKELVTKVKYLVQDNSYQYIFSGSLLGVELTGLRSAPVGFLKTLELFPMDLEEFLFARSMPQAILTSLRASFLDQVPVDTFIHEKLMEAFLEYLVVGGMPEAVQAFIDTKDFNAVIDVHNTILPQYRRDFTQYEEANKKLKLLRTYDLIPAELNEKNKRYTFRHLDKNMKLDRYEDSFLWLIHAGVAIPTYNVTEPKIPLLANEKANLFKLFLSDIGMLSTLYGRTMILKTLRGDGNVNYGAVYENFVAQELHAHGYDGYYFNSKKQGEIDFLIEYEDYVLPLEVKSGKDYQKHSALNNILNNREYGISRAFVLSNDNIKKKGKILYLPIYMVMFLDEKQQAIPVYDVEDFANLVNRNE